MKKSIRVLLYISVSVSELPETPPLVLSGQNIPNLNNSYAE